MPKPYKDFIGITSQVPFCAVPLRLDPYNSCQFACEYCFASTRQGAGRKQALSLANAELLRARLSRVNMGICQSALDELIKEKIPFQIGGMTDPFSALERRYKTTLSIMKILAEYNYPYIISTKSTLLGEKEYLDVLRDSDVYVRFSTTVVDPKIRHEIDKKCPPLREIHRVAQQLASADIPISYRFQPIIPGHEKFADDMLEEASQVGVSHISGELLKVSIDANKNFGSNLLKLFDGDPIGFYRELGAQKVGREYVLPVEYRKKILSKIADKTRLKGMTFGFADNDLLLLSDGEACCGASNLYLKNASYFKANVVGLAKSKKAGEKLYFAELLNSWMPEKSVTNYLNSKARMRYKCFGENDWESYSRALWLGIKGAYSPGFFETLQDSKELDDFGMPIFEKIE